MPDKVYNTPKKAPKKYDDWEVFKIDLEAKLGWRLSLVWWLQIKPQKPLPWSETDLRTSLSKVKRTQESFARKSDTSG